MASVNEPSTSSSHVEVSSSSSSSSASDHKLAVAGPSNRMKTRHVANKLQYKCVYTHVENHKSPMFCVQFNYFIKESGIFACVGSNRVSVYDCLLNGKLNCLQVYIDPEEKEKFYTCAWSYTSGTKEPVLAAAGLQGIIRIILTSTMICDYSFIGHGGEIDELKFHPENCDLLLSASKDYTIRLWNVKTYVCIAIFGSVDGHRDGVLSIDFNFKGDMFVSCGFDHSVMFWKTDTPKFRKLIKKSYEYDITRTNKISFPTHREPYPYYSTRDVHSNYIDCIRWYNEFIISKSNDNLMKFWKPNLKDKTPVRLFHDVKLENCRLWFLKFSMDFSQEILALGNKSGKIFVYDLNSNDPQNISCTTLRHERCKMTIRHTGLNRQGLILIALGDDGSVWRWDRVVSSSKNEDDDLLSLTYRYSSLSI